MSDPDWMAMLREQAERTNNQAVADALGVSRAMISLVLNGKYDKSTERLQKAVLAKLDNVDCPHLGHFIHRAECDRFHRRNVPQSDASALKHWVVCRKCPVRNATLGVQQLEVANG